MIIDSLLNFFPNRLLTMFCMFSLAVVLVLCYFVRTS